MDLRILELWERGDHAAVLDLYPEYQRAFHPEGRFAHYLMALGALGGRACRVPGERLSEYENAVGTGQVHVLFRPERRGERTHDAAEVGRCRRSTTGRSVDRRAAAVALLGRDHRRRLHRRPATRSPRCCPRASSPVPTAPPASCSRTGARRATATSACSPTRRRPVPRGVRRAARACAATRRSAACRSSGSTASCRSCAVRSRASRRSSARSR